MSHTDEIGNGTAAGAIEYLDRIIEKGRGTPGAINPLKVAFEKVVSEVDGGSWRTTDVSSINVEEYIARFANLTRGKYTDKSLTVYKSRVNRVIGWYTKFMSKETPGYFPMLATRTPAKRAADKSTKRAPAVKSGDGNRDLSNINEAEIIEHVATGGTSNSLGIPRGSGMWPSTDPSLLDFPFPLGDGTIAHLHLPQRFTKQDAHRLSALINSLVYEADVE